MKRAAISITCPSPNPSSSGDPVSCGTGQNGNGAPPMEDGMVCMSVVVNGPNIAFACYNEERNEILLQTCRSSGYDTESIVEHFLQIARPNLVLVGNKVVQNSALLQMVTTPPAELPAVDAENEEPGPAELAQRVGGLEPSSRSIPYRLLKTGAFEVRACKANILQKLRVLSILNRQAREHAAGYSDPNRESRHFPRAGPHETFRPSSFHSLAAVVDFDSKVQVQALGSLLSFLQTTVFRLEDSGTITVNRVVETKSSSVMRIDAETFSALHIFATEHHPLIANGSGNAKEGFSLFSLLDRTLTKGGRQLLREWMLKPLTDFAAISERQDAVELFMSSPLQTTIGVILNLLAKVGPIDKILTRMQKCATQPMDFLILSRTLAAAAAIAGKVRDDILPRLEEPNDGGSCLLREVFEPCDSPVLNDLQEDITSVVDVEATNELRTSVVICRGLHEQLDQWKDQYEDLEDTLATVGDNIHDRHKELSGLSVVFVPQVGFLVALKKAILSEVDLPQDFTHIFSQDEEAFFKSDEMKGLDADIGDLDCLIKDTESMIVTELEERILDSESQLREIFRALSTLDCLLALSDCAVDLGFTRPKITEAATNRILIKEGRHPLQEVITERQFVPNGVQVDQNERVLVITGPNYSGKSCYLRQVGLLVYMAHIGSFIPCAEAEISITDQLCARISTIETCTVPQSSFQLDLTQMASILIKSTPNSLVLIDEFGKGTSPASGIAILAAALRKLAAIGCKTICTTHLLELFTLNVICDKANGIKARRMAVQLPKDEEDDAAPLFRLEDGVASSSAGLICAKKAGVNSKVVSRAKEIIDTTRQRRLVKPLSEAGPGSPRLGPDEVDLLKDFFSEASWCEASDERLNQLRQKQQKVSSRGS